jgi:hypothetical protein
MSYDRDTQTRYCDVKSLGFYYTRISVSTKSRRVPRLLIVFYMLMLKFMVILLLILMLILLLILMLTVSKIYRRAPRPYYIRLQRVRACFEPCEGGEHAQDFQ